VSTKLTPTELAAKLYSLQRALEDRTTASEMLAEAEGTITRLREEIGTDNDLVKVLFTQGPLPMVARKKKRILHRIRRAIWLPPTLEGLKKAGGPVTVAELAKLVKGTDAETFNNSILASRMVRLWQEGLVNRIENGRGTRYNTKPLAPGAAPTPIIQRHRGQVDSVSRDPHPWQVANRVAAQ